MRSRARWLVVTTALDADRLAELVLETHDGVRIERNTANRRVLAVYGVFVFRQKPSRHSTVILVSAARRLRELDRALALAARAAAESGVPSHVIRSWSITEVSSGGPKLIAGDTGNLDQPEELSEQEALAAMEDCCAELGIHLPACVDASDGLSCELEVHEGKLEDFDPFHVVVLEDHSTAG